MSRLFIIGAGFSKAIANAPLANGFIRAIYEKTQKEDDNYKHAGDWPSDRAAFIKLLTYFHNSIQQKTDWLEEQDKGRKILNREFEDFLNSLNVEFICSYLDLLCKHYFIPKAKGVDLQSCPIPFIHEFHKSELESALKFINHHMLDLLLLDNLSINQKAFDAMANFFEEGDMFISFNYDLLVEQMLWARKLWNPFDGYGFNFKKNGNKNVHKSTTQVIKIHGSINWRSPDLLFHPNLELAIDHPFKDEPLFEGLKIPESVYDKVQYRYYPLYSYIILPTFMKSPQFDWEISLVEQSLKFCKNSDEIFILGYSVPEADYITNLFFSQMNKKSKIRIILWDQNKYPNPAEELSNKLIKRYGFKRNNIIHEHAKIEDWINNDFNFINYEKYLEDQEFFNEIAKASKNNGMKENPLFISHIIKMYYSIIRTIKYYVKKII